MIPTTATSQISEKNPLILGKIVSLYADTLWKKSEHSLRVCRYAAVGDP
jgi:hypothetical protein